jgi:hypothetical protein
MKANNREQHIMYYINILHIGIINQVITHEKYMYLFKKKQVYGCVICNQEKQSGFECR